MMLKKNLAALICLCTVLSVTCYSQASYESSSFEKTPFIDSLKRGLANAKTSEAKIYWLGNLAGFYMNINTPQANAYGAQQVEVAELSRDRTLMIKALLSNAYRFYGSGGTQANFLKGKSFSEKALALAKSSHQDDHLAWAYIAMARGSRNEGSLDKALNYDNLAVSLAQTVNDDSLKIASFNSLGETYLRRKENLLAFRNFLQALNLSEESKKYSTLWECYDIMAEFYSGLDDYEKAKDYLYKAIQLTHKFKRPYDRLYVYNALGRVYAKSKQEDLAIEFFEKSMKLSDTLKFQVYKINAYVNILNLYLNSDQPARALAYFKGQKELVSFMYHAGFDYYANHAYALAYAANSRFDSAEFYFKKAEPDFIHKTNTYNQYQFYKDYAEFCSKRGNLKRSLEYWLKAKVLAEERHDLSMMEEYSRNLDSVYQKVGDYKNALVYNSKYHHYKDSLEKLSTEKDLLLLEVDNENKRKEKEAVAAEQATRDRHNIQYMGITAAIAAVFIVLVMLGIFSVSKGTIRVLGFFAFIFLFEFIILLADNQIHHWTHGEPWKVLMIKIVLISMLLPFHHFLEERVIHYLTSRKLMERRKGVFQKLAGEQETDPV